MIRIASAPAAKSAPTWHEPFLRMLPAIRRHARIAFRHLRPEAREEAVQGVVCNACSAVARLAEVGKLDLAYPTVLARFGVAQVRGGRMTGGRLNCQDVMSGYCQRLKGIVVERLDQFDEEGNTWQEVQVEDRHAGPAEVAATRMDIAAWMQRLPSRLRGIAKVLANGETTGTVAQTFGVSEGRVSQVRKELLNAWQTYQGERPATPIPAPAA